MDYITILKQHGHENDLCCRAIVEYFIENKPGVVHKDDLCRIPLKAWKPRQNKWEHFSIDTILRKARKLAEIGILQKDNLGSRNSTRYWVGDVQASKKVRYEPMIINGVRMARPVYE